MSDVTVGRAAPSGLGFGRVARWVCQANPFYLLSALLVCLGLWSSFGAQAGAGQSWALMGGMGVYTLLLAVPACLLVRYGGAWHDVRTVLLVVVLMFLAVSVTFDETLARDPATGAACGAVGLLFAAAVSEGLLRGMRLGLPAGFRAPYYLALLLFFGYPAALAPLLHDPRSEALQWAIFGFGPAAGLVTLCLLPAVRRGADYVRDNGSPWRWPYYPWSLFAFLGLGAAGRSYLLCLSMMHVERTDPERSIFGPFFLVPLGLAAAVLLLEAGLATRHKGLLAASLALAAGLVVLAGLGLDRPDDLLQGFVRLFRRRLGGTPLSMTVWAAAGFYVYAAARGVPGSWGMLTLALLALAVVGPATFDADSLVAPRPLAVGAAAALQLALGLWRRERWRGLVAAGVLALGVAGAARPEIGLAAAFHILMLAALVVGAAGDDDLALVARAAGAWMAFGACLFLLTAPPGLAPAWVVSAYAPSVGAALGVYGLVLKDRSARWLAASALGCWLAAAGWGSYRRAREVVAGLDLIVGGLVLLALAQLISLGKAGLWPRRFAPGKPDPVLADD